MIKELRQLFNENFSENKYKNYLKKLNSLHPGTIDFRIAETPVFIPLNLKNNMIDTCEQIIDLILDTRFKSLTQKAIPKNSYLPNETNHPHFLLFDFGICENNQKEIEPQLIEMQGFPSLFAFQVFHNAITKDYANQPDTVDSYLNGYNEQTYVQLLKEIIIGDTDPENVILLDIFPEHQKTKVDFFCTEELLGIKTVCITKLFAAGKKLFYEMNGERIEIKRIYNRLIFDDLQQHNLNNIIDLTQEWDVEWVTHPNWFYRISKYVLPFLHNPFVPKTYFLNEIKQLPSDLENFVLKPLFSFAGTGVIIDLTIKHIDDIPDPENWILQRKVKYAGIIQTPGTPAKAEVRIFYLWKEEWQRPIAVHNLARLSKGKMIGTRYNKDQEWVGASIAFFEK